MHIYANFYVTAGQTANNVLRRCIANYHCQKTGRLYYLKQNQAKRVYFRAENNAPFFVAIPYAKTHLHVYHEFDGFCK